MFQRIIEWLLDVPPSGPGQGTSWRYGSNFPWPDWVLLLFGLFAVIFVGMVYRRDASETSRLRQIVLIGLRLCVIGLLLFMLSEAAISVDRTGLPYVVVILDNSGSMTAADPYQSEKLRSQARSLLDAANLGDITPLNVGKAFLLEGEGAFLKRLLRRHKLRIYKLAGTAVEVADCVSPEEVDDFLPNLRELETEGDRSSLGKGLRAVLNDLRGAPPSAIVILTDGITTEGEKLSSAAVFAQRKGVRVFPVGLGDPEPLRDLEIADVQVEDIAFVNDPIKFLYTLTGRGFADQPLTVSLEDEATGQQLALDRVTLTTNEQTQKLEISFTPTEVGEFDFVVEVEPLPKESNKENNRQTRHVSVRKERIRVLLADSVPRFEFRFLKSLLEREKTVELKTVLQDADADFSEEDRTALQHFPVNADELFDFDVIIFGDLDPAFLTERTQKDLAEFVSAKSGGLMLIAGPRHNPLSYAGTPLADLLPIELDGATVPAPEETLSTGFQTQLTVNGQQGTSIFQLADNELDNQRVWDQLPPMYWMIEAEQVKRGALVFANRRRHSGEGTLPVISMQRFGGGKVLFHATDETWRWRFRVGDLYFGRYWVQTIRYLSRAKLLGRDRSAELSVDRREYVRGMPVQFRVNLLDDRLLPTTDTPVSVVVQQQGGARRKIDLQQVPQTPGVFEGRWPNPPVGTFHAFVASPVFSDSPPSVDFRVTFPLGEMRTVKMDITELTTTAKLSGGKYHALTQINELLAAIPPGHPVPLESDEPKALWNFWLTLSLVVTLLGAEWILRKRLRLL